MADLIGSLLYIHAGFMPAGFFAMLTGATAAMFLRHRRWWLRLHKTAGILGLMSVLAGLTAVIFMVSLSGGGHFNVTHAYVGAMTATFAVVTPILGTLQFRAKLQSAKIRIMHRWSGRFTLLFAVVTIITGLKTIGFL